MSLEQPTQSAMKPGASTLTVNGLIDTEHKADAAVLPDCPVCARNSWSRRSHGTRLRECAGCRTLLNDRSTSRQEEERRYCDWNMPRLADEDRIGESQWEWVTRTIKRTETWDHASILDIGCGNGAFLRAVRGGCEHSVGDSRRVMGIELNCRAVERCLAADLKVLQGSILEVGVPDGPWDLITLWDVLDHLERPDEALKMVATQLGPGGTLIIRGRNAQLHGMLKQMRGRFHKIVIALGLPDLSVVHRWGLMPNGYEILMRRAGLGCIGLQPALPTPGDRYSMLGPKLAARFLKGMTYSVAVLLHLASFKRFLPFSVCSSSRIQM